MNLSVFESIMFGLGMATMILAGLLAIGWIVFVVSRCASDHGKVARLLDWVTSQNGRIITLEQQAKAAAAPRRKKGRGR